MPVKKIFNIIIKRKQELELGFFGALASLALAIILRRIVAPLVRLFFVKEVEGIEHLPKQGPVIIASNHESYLDFICFWAVSPRSVQYLAAEVFYKSKFWRPLMFATGQIRVDRYSGDKQGKAKAKEHAYAILKNEGVLGIFPEGTRTRSGEMGKAFTGVTRFALEARAPILPVGMVGTFDIWPPHKRLPKLKRCKIRIAPPLHHHEHFDKEHTEELLRHLTDELMLVIAGLAGKEYKHHYKLDGNDKGKVVEGEIIKNESRK